MAATNPQKKQPTADAPSASPGPENAEQAHRQAEADISGDIETSAHSSNDDLDEGELARLGEEGSPVE